MTSPTKSASALSNQKDPWILRSPLPLDSPNKILLVFRNKQPQRVQDLPLSFSRTRLVHGDGDPLTLEIQYRLELAEI